MSGGVDSSVSAILLQEQGYEVVGCYMKNWSEDLPGAHCPWAEDLADAKRVATKLGLDFKVFDFEKEYKQKVVDYMIDEYRAGRTPNPDIMCNQEIKFRLFYDIAISEGADFVATGHYACIERSEQSCLSAPLLMRAVDEAKDQTYFLARMPQDALEKTIFPVGHLTKSEVKQIAQEHNLSVSAKKESMGICFVGEVDIRQFLKQYIDAEPGPIIDAETGKKVGTHEGVPFYTIGQRHGLYLPSDLPYYVVKKDAVTNTIYVSKNLNSPDLWKTEIKLTDIIKSGDLANIKVRTRHRAPLIEATLDGDTLKLSEPQKALNPGQFVVFYGGDNHQFVLGSAIIAE